MINIYENDRPPFNPIEAILIRLGIPYYVDVKRLPERIGISRWRLRLAIESKSLPTVCKSVRVVSRLELANWITKHEDMRKMLFDLEEDIMLEEASEQIKTHKLKTGNFTSALRNAILRSKRAPLMLTHAALDPGIVITIGG